MCGLSFYLSRRAHAAELSKSSEAIAHRGPDGAGTELGMVAGLHFGMTHRRLSILDLSDRGSQPMSSAGRIIVFNGEIYNYRSLREELMEQGFRFVTGTDTEVLLKGYVAWGERVIERLDGMFAFVIVDTVEDRVVMARDPLGIKPLYLYSNNESLYCSSEIRGLTCFDDVNVEVSTDDLYEFFQNGFVYEPRTGLQGIEKLLPGTYRTFERCLRQTEVRYYRPLDQPESMKEGYEALVCKSVRQQLVADAPVGIFFSGGVDSTVIALESGSDAKLLSVSYKDECASDHKASSDDFCIDEFNARYHYQLEKVHITHDCHEDILASFRFVARNTEELISDYTYYASYEISQAASKSGYKVMLSGMGGDEVFAGYPRLLQIKYAPVFRMISLLLYPLAAANKLPKSLSKKAARFYAYFRERNFICAYSRLIGYFSEEELTEGLKFETSKTAYIKRLEGLFGEQYSKLSRLKKGILIDSFGFLSHNLMVADKSSMAVGVEVRVPLVDKEIYHHVLHEKDDRLIRGTKTKYILKALLRGKLPNRYIDRKKKGFNPPIEKEINALGEDRICTLLGCGGVYRYLERPFVEKVLAAHFSGKCNNAYKIWQLIYFHYWLEWAAELMQGTIPDAGVAVYEDAKA